MDTVAATRSPARRALEEHLAASEAFNLERLGAGYAGDARLRTHEGDTVEGRDAVVAWFASRESFFRSLAVHPERIEVLGSTVVLDWWGETPTGTRLAGRDAFDVDGGGRIVEQRVVQVGRTDRQRRDVRCEIEPPVARLVLDRAAKRNAVSQSMLADMTAFVREIDSDDRVRALLLAGEGADFCAGEDVRGFDFADERRARAFLDGPLTFFASLELLPVPVVVSVQGHALGFGSEVLLVADAVYAAPTATFGFAEIDHGAVPSVLVTRGLGVVGRRRAMDLALTGRRFAAAEAWQLGLVHVVADDPRTAAEDALDMVAGWPPASVRTVTRLLTAGVLDDHADARDFMPPVLTQVRVAI